MTNQQVQHTTSAIQIRTYAAFLMALFLLCVEHVRAFADQYHLSRRDVAVLGSAASSLSRKIGARVVKVDSSKKSVSFSGATDFTGGEGRRSGSTKLSMAWSIPAVSLPNMPTLTSKDWPVHALGSWYEKVDPTNTLPVYDDEYENAYSYTTDDWPSILSDADDDRTLQRQPPSPRRRPFRAIRRAAGRFVGGVVRYPRSQ